MHKGVVIIAMRRKICSYAQKQFFSNAETIISQLERIEMGLCKNAEWFCINMQILVDRIVSIKIVSELMNLRIIFYLF